jgi:hypothetical protein
MPQTGTPAIDHFSPIANKKTISFISDSNQRSHPLLGVSVIPPQG